MKAILEIILRIIKHPGVLRIIMEIFKAIESILQDNDNSDDEK